MRKIYLFIIFSFLVLSLNAAKEKKPSMKSRFKEAKEALKNSSGQDNAINNLLATVDTGEVDKKFKARAYYYIARLKENNGESENLKAYLKQQCDTAKLFNMVLDVHKFALRCDSFDENRTYTRGVNRLLRVHHENLFNGGRYYMRKGKWAEAYNFFDMFLSTHPEEYDEETSKATYLATICGVNLSQPYKVLKYVEKAMSMCQPEKRAPLAEYQARSILAVSDSANWIKYIEKGEAAYPGYKYFFLNLIDWYIHHGMYEVGLVRTDNMMIKDGKKAVYWYAKSLLAMYKKDYVLCNEMSDKCLEMEPDNQDALYNKGISLCNLALDSKDVEQRNEYYRQALPPLEKLRNLDPKDTEKWGAVLYRIYFNLNMGKKFEEIDKLLKRENN